MNLENYPPHLCLSLAFPSPAPSLLKLRSKTPLLWSPVSRSILFPPRIVSLCLVTGERTWALQNVISKLFLADWTTEQQLAITAHKIHIKLSVLILWSNESHSLCKLNTDLHVEGHSGHFYPITSRVCVGGCCSPHTSFITSKCWYAWLKAGQNGTIPLSSEQAPFIDKTLPSMPGW